MDRQRVDDSEPAERLRVIYIMGAGRSGSTVLDTVLGNHPAVVNVGELVNLQRSGWQRGELCSCGAAAGVCPFWSRVRQVWESRSPVGVAEYVRLQDRFERFGAIPWARLMLRLPRASWGMEEYLEATRALYEAIAEAAGKRVIVDSSKGPLRAELLSRIPALDLRYLHLVRDGRAVAWSRRKAFEQNTRAGIQRALPPRPASYSVAYWLLVNTACDEVLRRSRRAAPGLTRAARLHYEDFVTNPSEALATIEAVVGLGLDPLREMLTRDVPFRVGHVAAGNRLRMSGAIRLQPDFEWRERLSRREQQICLTIAGWKLREYGYAA